MKTYLETHPWLTFKLDLTRADHVLWMLLGEACSKAEHLTGIPLLPEVADRLYRLFLVKGVLATTQIEGNTLTEDQVGRLLSGELELPPSKQYLGQEIENILEACQAIGERALRGEKNTFESADIKRYNELVLRKLPLEEHVVPGKIRKESVGVGRYLGPPAGECEYLLQRMCSFLNEEFKADTLSAPAVGILKAIVAHVYLAWIHPFGDGNGRTARLIEFRILLSAGISSTAAHLFSNHYNITRAEYYRQLQCASASGGDLSPFIQYALQGFVDGLRSQIELVKRQQLFVHWTNFIFERFKDLNSDADLRRRRLVRDLTKRSDPVPFSNMRYVSPRVAEEYADKTDKTLRRDLAELESMELIRKGEEGWVSRIDRMFAFMPQKAIVDPDQMQMDFPEK